MRRRVLLASGIVAPLLYALADALAGTRWEGYSFRDQTISELGAIGFHRDWSSAATAFGRRFHVYTIATIILALGFGAWTTLEIS